MLDLTKVRVANGSKAAGFEELCVHLAEAMCQEPLSHRQRVHGAGGDGGVEAIVTTESGRRVGIQCKYFLDNLTAVQWTQIKKSVGQVMLKHSNLREYFVCVPRDRTPGQNENWEKLVANWRARYPNLTVTWFGQSELTSLLVQPRWNYLATYWLGDPDYSSAWLGRKVEQAISQLHRRFTPRLHNNTLAEKGLATLLALPEALSEYQNFCRDLAVNARDLSGTLSRTRKDELGQVTEASGTLAAAMHNVLSGMADGELLAQDFHQGTKSGTLG